MPFFASNPTAVRRARHAAAIVATALGALALAGCESMRGWVPPLIQPYRPDVQQGNVVTREMVDQLREGMTRDQVRFLLGTPMLASVFHPDRWDYVYYLKRGKGSETQTRRLTVRFKDNRVLSLRADEMPAEALADNLILGREATKAPPKNPPTRPPEPAEPPPGPIYK
jgi:outer membrane protein assembly factor BamE